MGSSTSKEQKLLSYKEQIKAGVEEEISRRMMVQRELNMALNIAKARDSLQIFGSIYATFVSGLGVAKMAGKPVSHLAGIPVVIGAVVLGNMADMAYGNKLGRVCQEAEYILDNERPRFVPFKQVRRKITGSVHMQSILRTRTNFLLVGGFPNCIECIGRLPSRGSIRRMKNRFSLTNPRRLVIYFQAAHLLVILLLGLSQKKRNNTTVAAFTF